MKTVLGIGLVIALLTVPLVYMLEDRGLIPEQINKKVLKVSSVVFSILFFLALWS